MRHSLVSLAGVALTVAGCGSVPPSTAPAPVRPPASPAPAPTAIPAPPPAGANHPPELVLRISPSKIRGPAPLTVEVDLCDSSDADGEGLVFAYEWAGEGKRLTGECRASRTYEVSTHSFAYFCVWDYHPEHLVCRRFNVAVE